MFVIISNVIISIFLALLFASGVVVLLVFLIKSVCPQWFTNSSVGVGIVLTVTAFFVFFQSFLFCEACFTKKHIHQIEEEVLAIISIGNNRMNNSEVASLEAKVGGKYPFISRYLKGMNGRELTTNVGEVGSYIRSEINFYIWRRVGWTLGMLLCVVCWIWRKGIARSRSIAYSGSSSDDFNF